MIDKIQYGSLMLIPLIWAYSIYLVIETPYFKWFVIINILVLLISWFSLQLFSKTLFGHDEYGLGPLGGIVLVALIQIILSLIFAVYFNKKHRHSTKSRS